MRKYYTVLCKVYLLDEQSSINILENYEQSEMIHWITYKVDVEDQIGLPLAVQRPASVRTGSTEIDIDVDQCGSGARSARDCTQDRSLNPLSDSYTSARSRRYIALVRKSHCV